MVKEYPDMQSFCNSMAYNRSVTHHVVHSTLAWHARFAGRVKRWDGAPSLRQCCDEAALHRCSLGHLQKPLDLHHRKAQLPSALSRQVHLPPYHATAVTATPALCEAGN